MISDTRTVPAPLIALNIGRAQTSTFRGKPAVSAIGKLPVDRTLELGMTGLNGDEQADLVNHGGPDKAVCVYSYVNYPHWERVLNRRLPHGAFGENFTVDLWTEKDVCIGDVFRVGTAAVQISQPRVPCWKLAMKWGLDNLPDRVAKSGATGFYFRVLQTGEVRAGDTLMTEDRHPASISVAEANRIMHHDKNDAEGIRKLLALGDVLAMSWIVSLDKRLARLQAEDS